MFDYNQFESEKKKKMLRVNNIEIRIYEFDIFSISIWQLHYFVCMQDCVFCIYENYEINKEKTHQLYSR